MAEVRENLWNITFLCIVLVVQTNVAHSKLSDYTTICSAKDPKLNECLKESAMEMISNMTYGIPEFGLPSIDPFHMSNAFLEEPHIGLALSFSNLTVYNLRDAIITGVSAHPEKFTFQFSIHIPNQVISGRYKIKGKIFIMPIHGDGLINVTLMDVNTTLQFSGKPETEDGQIHMKLANVSVSLEPKRAKLYLDNLFNGNEMLGSVMNNVLNDSWQELFIYLKPKLERIYENEVFVLLGQFLSQVPYNQLFRDYDV